MACAEGLRQSQDLMLAAMVRRFDSQSQALPDAFSKIVSHAAQSYQMDAALLCVPMAQGLDAAHDCLQHGVPIIESSLLHGEPSQAHGESFIRLATCFNVSAIVGGEWDPECALSSARWSACWCRRANEGPRIVCSESSSYGAAR